jgi:hypothetical protein
MAMEFILAYWIISKEPFSPSMALNAAEQNGLRPWERKGDSPCSAGSNTDLTCPLQLAGLGRPDAGG